MSQWLPTADYQDEAAKFLSERKWGLLADECGVGKSASAIRACDLIGAQKILVLVPASVRTHWIDEFRKFSPMDRNAVAIMDGKGAPENLTVCSYDLLANPKLKKAIISRQWDVVILDEAHYLKSRTARRTKAVYGRRCDASEGSVVGQAKHVWLLSGTPAPNHADELWTHLHAAGLFDGSWYSFVEEFCNGYTSDYGFKITGHKNVDKLKSILRGIAMRRTKSTTVTLPKIYFHREFLPAGPVDVKTHFPDQTLGHGRSEAELMADLRQTEQDVAAAIRVARTAAEYGAEAAFGVLGSLMASTATLRRYAGLSLVPAYLDYVKPLLDSGKVKKLVIFAYHLGVLEELRWALKGYGTLSMNGSVDPKRRGSIVTQFQTKAHKHVFIGQLVAAGTGINLTAAHHLHFLEQSWVPGENAQAAMRIHRVGQEKACHVTYFGLKEGVHRDIFDAVTRKTTELINIGL